MKVLSFYIIIKYTYSILCFLFFVLSDHTRAVSSGKPPKTVSFCFTLLPPQQSEDQLPFSANKLLSVIIMACVTRNSGVCLGIPLTWSYVGRAAFGKVVLNEGNLRQC